MKSLYLCLVMLALLSFNSCSDSDEPMAAVLDCDKLTSYEEAQNVMNQANENEFSDAEQIIQNLIGEWGLIGIAQGWGGFETGQECIRLTIDANNIELEDLNSDNDSASEWELKTFEVNGHTGFYLETNEDTWNNRIGMQVFSENLMFGSGRVDDGDNYIYEKLR